MKNDLLLKIALELIQLVAEWKAFLFSNSKIDHWCSRADFFLFSWQNLTFKHSVDAAMSIEAMGSKKFEGFGV